MTYPVRTQNFQKLIEIEAYYLLRSHYIHNL